MADKELTADEKAEHIGKEIIDDAKVDNDPVPDYEITEEGDAQVVENKDDDRRLGKNRQDAPDREQKKKDVEAARQKEKDGDKLTNRERRLLRKDRLGSKLDGQAALIQQQQAIINQLAERMNQVDGKLSQVDYQTLVGQYNEARGNYQLAENAHKEAFKNGDADGATAAMRQMYQTQKKIDEIEAIDARNRELAGQPRQQVQQQPQNQAVVSKAQEWGKRNPWFKSGGRDDDSAIADTIAAKLVRDGFDPQSDDYWDELDDRLSTKGIGDAQDDDYDDQQSQSQSQRERQTVREKPQRRSPPVGGGNGRGDLGAGKTAVTLPTVFINALKEAGIWDDQKRRSRAIQEHLRIKAERG